MKQLYVMVLIAGLLVSVQGKAQKVYKENDGSHDRVILDLTEDAGMPAGAITNVSKTAFYKTYTPSATSIVDEDNKVAGKYDKRVYQKLEIAIRDLSSNSDDATAEEGSSSMPITWIKGYNACLALTHNGKSDWRLPTQQELKLMYIFREAIKDLGVTDFDITTTYGYWSATEFTNATASYMNFETGQMGSYNKPYDRPRVRCVREIPNP